MRSTDINIEPPNVSIPLIENRFKETAAKEWSKITKTPVKPDEIICNLGWRYTILKKGAADEDIHYKCPARISGELSYKLFEIIIDINFGKIIPNLQTIKKSVSDTIKNIRPCVIFQNERANNFTIEMSLVAALMTKLQRTENFFKCIAYPKGHKLRCEINPISWSQHSNIEDRKLIKWNYLLKEEEKEKQIRMHMTVKQICSENIRLGNSRDNIAKGNLLILKLKLPQAIQLEMIGKDITNYINLPAYKNANCIITRITENKDKIEFRLKNPTLNAYEIWDTAIEMERNIKLHNQIK